MKPLAIIVLVIISLFLSCNTKYDPSNDESLNKLVAEDEKFKIVEGNMNKFFSDTTGVPQAIAADKQQHSKDIPNQDWDKKIIKTASLNIEVKDYNAYYSFLREKVKNLGGYIAQENQNQSDYKVENNLQIKVPVDQFDDALALLTTNIEKLNEKKVSSQDVTAEFVDTRSRIETKKQVRQRYTDLLRQAKNMQEILSVQSEINGIQEQIESGMGRIQYLGHSSVFSTINITYYQVLNASAKGDETPSFGTQLSSAFHKGWSWIGEVFVGLVSIWPLFLFVFIGIIIYKKIKLQKTKQVQ